jgi:hypothetical protein
MSVASDAISTELTSDYQTRQRIQVDTDSNLSVACANPGVATASDDCVPVLVSDAQVGNVPGVLRFPSVRCARQRPRRLPQVQHPAALDDDVGILQQVLPPAHIDAVPHESKRVRCAVSWGRAARWPDPQVDIAAREWRSNAGSHHPHILVRGEDDDDQAARGDQLPGCRTAACAWLRGRGGRPPS